MNAYDIGLWRIIHHYVDKGRSDADYSEVKQINFYETSGRRGYNYLGLFVGRPSFATEGKDSSYLPILSKPEVLQEVYNSTFRVN